MIAQLPIGAQLQLHASGLKIGGRVVLFAGAKGSGKTTTLAHLAGSVGAAIVANDRVLVHRAGGSWDASGVPTIVSLRAGTMAALPRLLSTAAARGRTVHLTIAEVEGAPANSRARVPGRDLGVSLAQFGHLLAAPLAAGGPIGCIALLRLNDGVDSFTVRQLSPPEVESRLGDSRFGATDIGPRPPTVFETWLGREPRVLGGADLLEPLARAVPCADVCVGPGLLASEQAAVDLLGTLARLT